MSTGTHKHEALAGRELRHSAFQEFAQDERRPVVLLLAALVIATAFFALGILFDRWTLNPEPQASGPGKTVAVEQPAAASPGAADLPRTPSPPSPR